MSKKVVSSIAILLKLYLGLSELCEFIFSNIIYFSDEEIKVGHSLLTKLKYVQLPTS